MDTPLVRIALSGRRCTLLECNYCYSSYRFPKHVQTNKFTWTNYQIICGWALKTLLWIQGKPVSLERLHYEFRTNLWALKDSIMNSGQTCEPWKTRLWIQDKPVGLEDSTMNCPICLALKFGLNQLNHSSFVVKRCRYTYDCIHHLHTCIGLKCDRIRKLL